MSAEFQPVARVTDLVTTEVEGGILVYDQQTYHLHHVNAPTVTIWHLCDGQSSVTEIAGLSGMDESTVRIALTTLTAAGLLDVELPPEIRMAGQSRRRFLKRAAVAGGVPAIVSVTAPVAAQQGSGIPVVLCNAPNQCDLHAGQCRCRCRPQSQTVHPGLCNVNGECRVLGACG